MAHHAEGAAEDPHQRENIDPDDQRKVSGAAPRFNTTSAAMGRSAVFGVARFGGSAGIVLRLVGVALPSQTA
ncbi:hypothetical protein M8494_06895 [Serratia ureilytica]